MVFGWLRNSFWLGVLTGCVLVIAAIFLLSMRFPLFVYTVPDPELEVAGPTVPVTQPEEIEHPVAPTVTELLPDVKSPQPLVDIDRQSTPVEGLRDHSLAPTTVEIPEGSTNSPSLFRPDF
ncbi:hypothetical protein [Amaricoccus tamworthensis]|uniref:hypothetical protein n=1 Tax=Amaricoccus tamworthensis TaxID=57002 RepID=UPI003C7A0328